MCAENGPPFHLGVTKIPSTHRAVPSTLEVRVANDSSMYQDMNYVKLCMQRHGAGQNRGRIQLLPIAADTGFSVCACKLPEIPKGRGMQGQRVYLLPTSLFIETSHSKDGLKWAHDTECRLDFFLAVFSFTALWLHLLWWCHSRFKREGKNKVPRVQPRHHTVSVFL